MIRQRLLHRSKPSEKPADWSSAHSHQTLYAKANGKSRAIHPDKLARMGYARAYATSQQRAEELPFWMHRYNWHRPHGSIGAKPPISNSADWNNLLRLHIRSLLPARWLCAVLARPFLRPFFGVARLLFLPLCAPCGGTIDLERQAAEIGRRRYPGRFDDWRGGCAVRVNQSNEVLPSPLRTARCNWPRSSFEPSQHFQARHRDC